MQERCHGFFSDNTKCWYVGMYFSFTENVLEMNLYDVKTRGLIWSGRTSIYDDRSTTANMKDIVSAIIRDLHKQGMVK